MCWLLCYLWSLTYIVLNMNYTEYAKFVSRYWEACLLLPAYPPLIHGLTHVWISPKSAHTQMEVLHVNQNDIKDLWRDLDHSYQQCNSLSVAYCYNLTRLLRLVSEKSSQLRCWGYVIWNICSTGRKSCKCCVLCHWTSIGATYRTGLGLLVCALHLQRAVGDGSVIASNKLPLTV